MMASKNIILICDDESVVVRTCAIAITEAGFRAVVAENGIAGLETYMRLREQICLVLTDIIMPVMGGTEMAQKILEVDAQAKILLMSGYSDNVTEVQGRKQFPFIRKPFIYSVFIDKIRSLLGEAAASTHV